MKCPGTFRPPTGSDPYQLISSKPFAQVDFTLKKIPTILSSCTALHIVEYMRKMNEQVKSKKNTKQLS